ncbi:hypothetical protein NP493_751g00012 [Ridgeia piscesae]|uniref:Transmembrane protein n=1 Tax=Ridgeia piscesae TaxID=27915 RepID=A0AAD9KP19_RIDPI|nr:hypothetical protein NP493_751g00012 [Ridgeia piscesae]
MFTGFMSSGVHVYVFFSNEALVGRGDSRVTATVSPSGSDVVTVRVFCCPWVTLKTLSTVMLGLALAAAVALFSFFELVANVAAAASSLPVTARSKRHSLFSPHVFNAAVR